MRAALDESELRRIEAAVREAERGTTAEIIVVVDQEGSGHTEALLATLIVALAIPAPLLLLAPHLAAVTVYTIQLAVLGAGLVLSLLPAARDRLIPVATRRARARRAARDQFFERGLHLTAGRTGVLLFVSVGDRCAELIADAGAQGPLPDAIWRPCLEELLAEARKGRLAEGIVAALTRLGAVLYARLPAGPGDRNELPDKPVVL